jgi:uncharacterized RmlC-like cupin family protein
MLNAAEQVHDFRPTEQHCVTIKPAGLSHSKQGHHVFEGISAQSTGAHGLCLHVIEIPPGGRARAHLHEGHESAVYQLHGATVCWYGDRLEHRIALAKGEMAYIPAGVPHLPINASEHESATCLVARTDPDEQESVVLLPELEALGHTQLHDGVVIDLDSVRRAQLVAA